MERLEKVKGSLFGGAIGDALGYQIEFETGIKNKQVTKYAKNYGIITDDTQMTLFTANSLLWRDTRYSLKGIAPSYSDAIYMGYLDWLETQTRYQSKTTVTWVKNISELNQSRAPGSTCLTALLSGKKGTIEEPLNYSKGCGSVMRVAPIGLYFDDAYQAGLVAAEAAAITHGHPAASISSFVCSSLISILMSSDKTIEGALREALDLYCEKFDQYSQVHKENFLDLMHKTIELSKSDIDDIKAIKELGEGWVADEALAIALYSCLKYSNDFKEAIVCAVNHDGDSDSTGAIAGNIIGAYLGYSKIPKYYVDNLELTHVIDEIATDLIEEINDKENDSLWLDKYVYLKSPIYKAGREKKYKW